MLEGAIIKSSVELITEIIENKKNLNYKLKSISKRIDLLGQKIKG